MPVLSFDEELINSLQINYLFDNPSTHKVVQ